MAPSSEVHAGAFECESARDSRTDPPSGACHEYTFVFEALHTFLSCPDTTAIGVFSITQLTTLNAR